MERALRKTRQTKRIIEISDSNDDSDKDENYVPKAKVAKGKPSKKKAPTVKNDTKADSKKRKASAGQPPERKKQKEVKQENENVKTEIVVDAEEPIDSKEEVRKVRNSRIKKKQENEDVKTEIVADAEEPIDSKKQVRKGRSKKEKVENSDKENIKDTIKDVDQLRFNDVECSDWTDVDYVSEVNNIDRHIAQNVIKLFDDDNTIPFIARYRKNMTGGMEPDKLRALKESFDQAKAIKRRAATILKSIDKLGQWTPNIHSVISSAKCLEDLEHIYSFFKPASKKSLADRAREVGLGPVSDAVLQGQALPELASLVNPRKVGLKSEEEIKESITHIIGDIINKDKTVFDTVKELQSASVIRIQTSECKSKKSSDSKEKDVNRKYEMYYDFNATNMSIRPHQILAINRGEAQKILNVKIILPDFLEKTFKKHCCMQYKKAMSSELHATLMNESIDYAYTKFIKPLIVRRVRSELKQKAEAASIEVFVTNVKQLLLTPPVRGKIILGIDPGFTHGCKLAVISEHGNVLETSVIYPHKNTENSYEQSADTLKSLVKKHKCTIFALGNATACRETEAFLNSLIKSKSFDPIDVSYTIVDEAGASIYSCSTKAKSEFPDLDTNLISAVSIARRLQDPLAELVKVEPKHLGVGMYQHDLPEKELNAALDEVVSEAVSFVGVDVNTASQYLLKRVAGLNASRANGIIERRTKYGAFTNRQQLLDVKGIGPKSFEQCAGFIRVSPETSRTDTSAKTKSAKDLKNAPNLLDQTWIHPESYEIAERFLEYCECNLTDLGSNSFIDKITSRAKEGCAALAAKFGTDETTMEIIVKGLSMKKDEDIRLKTNYPLFRNSMLSINDIRTGTMLTGAVRNVTHFGAFVDVGVGRDGLVPSRFMNNNTLTIGQRVEVKVLEVDPGRNRISLELMKAL